MKPHIKDQGQSCDTSRTNHRPHHHGHCDWSKGRDAGEGQTSHPTPPHPMLVLGARGRDIPSLKKNLEEHNFFLLMATEVGESHSQEDKIKEHKKKLGRCRGQRRALGEERDPLSLALFHRIHCLASSAHNPPPPLPWIVRLKWVSVTGKPES